jgi:hypothetical protein
MYDLSILSDFVTEVIKIGSSAFVGAWAAFLFERKRAERQDERDHYTALRYAHFATIRQYVELLSVQKKVLQKYKDRADAWRTLAPQLAVFTTPRFTPSDLAFLLESSDPDLINRLTVGQQRYESTRGTLEARDHYHKEYQRRMAVLLAHGVKAVESEGQLHNAIGKDLIEQLRDATAALFHQVEDATTFLKKNLDDVEAFCRLEFPKRRPPGFSVEAVDAGEV